MGLEPAQQHRAVSEGDKLWRLQGRQKFREPPRVRAQSCNGVQLGAVQHRVQRELAFDAVGVLGARRMAPALAQGEHADFHRTDRSGRAGVAKRIGDNVEKMWRAMRMPQDPGLDAPIRERVIAGLARNRSPGLHFAGNFAQLTFDAAPAGASRVRMPPGPHLEEADGETSLCAVAMLADVALGVAIRSRLAPESRLATVALHLQLSGARLSGPLAANGAFESFLEEAKGRQGLARVTLESAAGGVAFGSGAFMALPPPPGVALHPVVRERGLVPLAEAELDDNERALLQHADAAIAHADAGRAFISHFWGCMPEATANGARCVTPNGPQIANRVGHVQGGILVGLAASTAGAALGPTWKLSSVSSWFVSPGEGAQLETRSEVEHRGRLTAVVRTRITGAGGRRVLESVSSHALRPG